MVSDAPGPARYELIGVRRPRDHRVEVRADGWLWLCFDDDERADRELRLENLQWRILDVLVRERPSAFDKVALARRIREIYPDQGSVSPGAIPVHISHLRTALEDDAADPGFVETVPRRGYRLCAEVRGESTPAPIQSPISAPISAPVSAQISAQISAPSSLPSSHAGDAEPVRGPTGRSARAEAGTGTRIRTGPRTSAGTGAEPSTWLARNRRLVILGLALLATVPVVLLAVRQQFDVGTGRLEHGDDPLLAEWADRLPERLENALSDLPEWSLYGFSEFPLDRPARIEGRLGRGGNQLHLEARLTGLPSGCVPEIRQAGPETFADELVTKLADDVRLHLDWEACVHPLRLPPWENRGRNDLRRARHCLAAGEALRWGLRYCDAKELLVMATNLDPGLHRAWDLLASVHQNNGNDDEALEILHGYLERVNAEARDGSPPEGDSPGDSRGDAPSSADEAAPLPMAARERAGIERRIAQLEGDYDRALEILARLAQQDPSQRPALAWFYLTHRQDCETALEVLGDDHAHDALQADFELACGRPDRAIELYERHDEAQGDPGALYALAHGYRLGGRPEQARTELETVLELDPKHHRARLELVALLAERGLGEEARQHVETLLGQLLAADEPTEGTRCLRDQVDRVEPSLCRPRVLERDTRIAAALLHEVGAVSYPQAVEHARAARSSPAFDTEAPHRGSMRALWAEGRAHLAAGYLDRVELVEGDMEAIHRARVAGGSRWEAQYLHHLRGRRWLAQGQPDRAVAELEQIFTLAVERRAFYHSELAAARWATGDREGARRELETALDADPRAPHALCALAELSAPATARVLRQRARLADSEASSRASGAGSEQSGPATPGGRGAVELPAARGEAGATVEGDICALLAWPGAIAGAPATIP